MSTEVYCTMQIDGTHSWPGCPFDEVAYLRDPHRHMFHIKAYKPVMHDDRDTEFIILKHHLLDYLRVQYYVDDLRTHVFGSMSCEMIAQELADTFDLSRCEVNEDGENGCVWTRD